MAMPFPSLVRRLAPVAVAVVAVVALGACGGDDDTTTGTTASQSTSTPPSTGPATTSTTGPERTTVVVTYSGGVVNSPDEVAVKVGDEVIIRAMSDVPEEVHVHTYDKRLDLAAGVPGDLSFKADIPGVHEVELEKAHKQLFRLRVQ